MEEQQIKDILDFVNSVLQNKSGTEYRSIRFTLELAEEVAKVIEQNKHLVPYHLNLIDELHINENGHSRILYKLLEYRNPDGDYIFLESLLKYIAKDYAEFEKISVTNPIITQELCRIDLWVRDDDYAIILENKVYNASDQEAQIADTLSVRITMEIKNILWRRFLSSICLNQMTRTPLMRVGVNTRMILLLVMRSSRFAMVCCRGLNRMCCLQFPIKINS